MADHQPRDLGERVLRGPVLVPSTHEQEDWSFVADPFADDPYHMFAQALNIPQERLDKVYVSKLQAIATRTSQLPFLNDEVSAAFGRIQVHYKPVDEVFRKIDRFSCRYIH